MKEARHKMLHTLCFHVYEKSRIDKFIETETDGGSQGAEGETNAEQVLNGYGFWDDEKVLEPIEVVFAQCCECT